MFIYFLPIILLTVIFIITLVYLKYTFGYDNNDLISVSGYIGTEIGKESKLTSFYVNEKVYIINMASYGENIPEKARVLIVAYQEGVYLIEPVE